MEKISLQKKSFFNSIGVDLNKIPSELKLKTSIMQEKLSSEIVDFFKVGNLADVEQKYFCLKNLFGTDRLEYNEKNWLEILMDNPKSDEIIKLYFKNPNYYFRELRKLNQSGLNHNNAIELYEDNGKFFVKDGVARLSIMMIKYLLEMSRATTKEEKLIINKQYIFAANVMSFPEDRDIVYLVSMLSRIYGSKLNITKSEKLGGLGYSLQYGDKKIEIKNKKELENFVKSSYLPKEYKAQDRLKAKVNMIAKIGKDYFDGQESEDLFLAIGKIFPNYETFIKYYQKMQDYGIEDKYYESINLENVTYEDLLGNLMRVVRAKETSKEKEPVKNTKKDETKTAAKKVQVVEQNSKNVKKLKENDKETEKAKNVKKSEESEENADEIKKNVNDGMKALINSLEMVYYKFKSEESNVFELASESKVVLNIDRISDDNINSCLNSIKSNTMVLKNEIAEEDDTKKLANIYSYVNNLKKSVKNEKIINEYADEMQRIYGACLNKHTQKIITDSKLNKLDIQRAEVESEKCSFFSKLIGKAKLKQARLDNINLKKQLILSESQFADKLHYYIEDGLSDLYAYIKNEEEERCLVEAKSFTRLIEYETSTFN